MKTVAEVIHSAPVWVNPLHRIESAIMLMLGHDVGGLAVLEGDMLVGTVLYKHLLGVNPNRTVGEVMDRNVVSIPMTASIRQAADLMIRENRPRLPVVDADGRLIGMVTHADLLAYLRYPLDPTTELPRSDAVYEWAIEALEQGSEVTVLFIDINSFGEFNKLYGHVIGDLVLRRVADVLKALTDPAIEALCRYGGDEFCIVTMRSAPLAEALSERIASEVARLRLPETQETEVTVAIGMMGGRRTREREQIHFASTLNSLINLASQECMAKKTELSRHVTAPLQESDAVQFLPILDAAERVADVAEVYSERLRLVTLDISRNERTSFVRVELERRESVRRGDRALEPGSHRAASEHAERPIITYASHISRDTDEAGLLEVVAEATITALRRALPPDYDIILEEVLQTPTSSGFPLISVVGQFLAGEQKLRITGAVVAKGDNYRAVALAVLAAANRQVERLLRDSDAFAR